MNEFFAIVVRQFLVCLASIMLFGCTQMQWQRDNTSQEQFEVDRKACEFEAIKSVQTPDTYMMITGRQEVGIACMKAKGYELAPRSRTAQAEFQGCANMQQVNENTWRQQSDPCVKK